MNRTGAASGAFCNQDVWLLSPDPKDCTARSSSLSFVAAIAMAAHSANEWLRTSALRLTQEGQTLVLQEKGPPY